MNQLTEYTGYLASLVVLLSFLMKNIRTLRWVNTAGCLLFIIYGFLLQSYPVILTNAAIVVINVIYLLRNARASEAG